MITKRKLNIVSNLDQWSLAASFGPLQVEFVHLSGRSLRPELISYVLIIERKKTHRYRPLHRFILVQSIVTQKNALVIRRKTMLQTDNFGARVAPLFYQLARFALWRTATALLLLCPFLGRQCRITSTVNMLADELIKGQIAIAEWDRFRAERTRWHLTIGRWVGAIMSLVRVMIETIGRLTAQTLEREKVELVTVDNCAMLAQIGKFHS